MPIPKSRPQITHVTFDVEWNPTEDSYLLLTVEGGVSWSPGAPPRTKNLWAAQCPSDYYGEPPDYEGFETDSIAAEDEDGTEVELDAGQEVDAQRFVEQWAEKNWEDLLDRAMEIEEDRWVNHEPD